MILRRFAIGLCALAFGAASPSLAAWQTFDTSDGLVSNSLLCMAIDRDGRYWFGGFGGVSCYDGVRWRSYTTADGLPTNRVNAIVQDHSGAMWFANSSWAGDADGGVTRFDGASWRTYGVADGLTTDDVQSLLVDRSGILWVGTFTGVNRFDGTRWTTIAGLTAAQTIYEDRAGNLWFGCGGAVRYDGTTWTTFTEADGLIGFGVHAILQDRSGAYWFGTRYGGMNRYDGTTWTNYRHDNELSDNTVNAICEDRDGKIWCGTGELYQTSLGGVSCFDGRQWTIYDTTDGLAANKVFSMQADAAGNLWFAGLGGLSRYDQSAWTSSLHSESPLSAYRVRALAEDLAGNIWVGLVSERELDPAGVQRFDGRDWTALDTEMNVAAVCADRAGNMWFGTDSGLHRFDGTNWTTYHDGLPGGGVHAIVQTGDGRLWVGTSNGASYQDSVGWRVLSGLNRDVSAIAQERSGCMWFGGGSDESVDRFDGTTWRTFRSEALEDVAAIVQDRHDKIWFAGARVSCFDGLFWSFYTQSDGLAAPGASALVEDKRGNLWFGTPYGVSRFDGTNWRTYTTADGLVVNWVNAVLEDTAGNLWFGTENGVSVYQPDRVPPLTRFVNEPGRLLGTRQVSAAVVPAFQEWPAEFSYALDDEAWSSWTTVSGFNRAEVADGLHVLRVRARDRDFNVEPSPAEWHFEIDASPPAPVIESPAFGQAVQGTVTIRGRASDARFVSYRLEVQPRDITTPDSATTRVLALGTEPVASGNLATWDTSGLPDGVYAIRLAVRDSLALTGETRVEVIVDNLPPWAAETSPALIRAVEGGQVYTMHGDVHVTFAPRSFARDVVVTIEASADSTVPASLPDGARRIAAGCRIGWGDVALAKPAVLELVPRGVPADAAPGTWAVYGAETAPGTWQRVGGTADATAAKISAPLRGPGIYALFAGGAAGPAPVLSAVSATPRVVSTHGNSGSDRVAIGFELGRAATVSVKIFNRAGRLVRELTPGQTLNAGANLVWWDGREAGGKPVASGLYVVSVDALGERSTCTLAVVE